MSVKALSAAFEESRAEGAAFTVLLALADWADHAGRCHPSYNQIAAKARVSRTKAIQAVEALIALGEIARGEDRHAPDRADDEAPATTRAQWRNTYRLLLVRPKPQVVAPVDHPHAAEAAGVVASVDHPQAGEVIAPIDHSNIREVVAPVHHTQDAQVVHSEPAGGALDPQQVVHFDDPYKGLDRQFVRPSVVRPSGTRGGHRRHVFCPPDRTHGFCVPEFLHRELETMLGHRAGDFDLLTWYVARDARRATQRPIVLDGLAWWRDELRHELVARGWAERRAGAERRVAPAFPDWTCPHEPPCTGRHACHVKTAIAKARAS